MARQWQVARVNMKAVKNFEEGKETTEVNPTEEQGDKAQKIKVNSSKTTISSKKKRGWTFFPSASLEESLGRGGAGRLWSFVPGNKLEQTKQINGSEMELDRMELSSVLRPEPGQLLGQVWFFQNFFKSQNRFGRRQQGGFTGCSMHLRMRKRRSLGAQPQYWEDSHLSLASLPLLLLGLYF